MQTAQPGLSSKVVDATVIRPQNDDEVQIVRDTAADGAGQYYGYTKLGKELIGGPGAPVILDSAYGQIEKTTLQDFANGSIVSWDTITSNDDVSLPVATNIRVAKAGFYRIEWKLSIASTYQAPA